MSKIIDIREQKHKSVYQIAAPIYWWCNFINQRIGDVNFEEVSIPRFTDNCFEINKLFTPCEDEDEGSTKIIFYLIQTMNKYLNHYRETGLKEYLWQVIQLVPASLILTGTITVDDEFKEKVRNLIEMNQEEWLKNISIK